MKSRIALSLLGLAALSGCTYFGSSFVVDELNKATPQGGPFHKALVEQYKARANDSQDNLYNYEQAYDNAERGLTAAEGQDVPPLDPANFDIPADLRTEIDTARTELTGLLSQNARENAPQEAATAQAKFDCWVEDAAKSWAPDQYKTCQADYKKAVEQLKNMVGVTPPNLADVTARGEAAVEAAAKSGQDVANFYIFFARGAKLPASAAHTLDTIADAVKNKHVRLVIINGYTDAKGKPRANERISQQRAAVVAEGLAARGVALQRLKVKGMGASDFLVPGKRGALEAANRRVEVRLVY